MKQELQYYKSRVQNVKYDFTDAKLTGCGGCEMSSFESGLCAGVH